MIYPLHLSPRRVARNERGGFLIPLAISQRQYHHRKS